MRTLYNWWKIRIHDEFDKWEKCFKMGNRKFSEGQSGMLREQKLGDKHDKKRQQNQHEGNTSSCYCCCILFADIRRHYVREHVQLGLYILNESN